MNPQVTLLVLVIGMAATSATTATFDQTHADWDGILNNQTTRR